LTWEKENMAGIFPRTQAVVAATGVVLFWTKPTGPSTNRYLEQFSCEQPDLTELAKMKVFITELIFPACPTVSGGTRTYPAGHSSPPMTGI